MSIRSILLVAALGFAGCAVDAAEESAATTQEVGGHFSCQKDNVLNVITCNETALLLPVTVLVKDIDVNVLNDADLDILTNNLNDLSVELKDVLNISKILSDNEVKVFDVLNDLDVLNVTKNKIDVCVLNLLGIKICQ